MPPLAEVPRFIDLVAASFEWCLFGWTPFCAFDCDEPALAAPADVAERDLTLPTAVTPDLDPIVAIQAFYVMAAQLSAARGMDPDQPRHLSKVTKTN